MKSILASIKDGVIVSDKLQEFISANEGKDITIERYYQPSTAKQHRLLMGYVYPNILLQSGMFSDMPERERRRETHKFFLEMSDTTEDDYKSFDTQEFINYLRFINDFCIDNGVDMDTEHKLDIYY